MSQPSGKTPRSAAGKTVRPATLGFSSPHLGQALPFPLLHPQSTVLRETLLPAARWPPNLLHPPPPPALSLTGMFSVKSRGRGVVLPNLPFAPFSPQVACARLGSDPRLCFPMARREGAANPLPAFKPGVPSRSCRPLRHSTPGTSSFSFSASDRLMLRQWGQQGSPRGQALQEA